MASKKISKQGIKLTGGRVILAVSIVTIGFFLWNKHQAHIIGKLLIDADRRYESVLIGNIIDHYTKLISDELNELQEVLS